MKINLPLLGAIGCAALCAGPTLAAPVFYCDAKSGRERVEEIQIIRTEYLPGLKEIIEGPPGLGDRAHAAEEFKEWTARLEELELGEKSCKELREFERPKPKTPKQGADGLVQPVLIPGDPDNDPRAAPPTPPPAKDDPPIPEPEGGDDLLVPVPPTPPAADDLLVPVPKTAPQRR